GASGSGGSGSGSSASGGSSTGGDVDAGLPVDSAPAEAGSLTDVAADTSVDAALADAGAPVCSQGQTQCASSTQRQTCSVTGTWVNATACVNQACVSGSCAGVCTP